MTKETIQLLVDNYCSAASPDKQIQTVIFAVHGLNRMELAASIEATTELLHEWSPDTDTPDYRCLAFFTELVGILTDELICRLDEERFGEDQ